MSLSLRRRQIVNCLLKEDKGVSVQDLARETETSERTIFRELQTLNELLGTYGLSLQHRKNGGGLSIEGSTKAIMELCRDLQQKTAEGIRPADRQAWLACHLLASYEPVKLFSLAVELQVAIPTVSNDLDTLEGWLASYHLKILRKPSSGISITGEESAKRSAIIDLLFAQFDETTLRGWFNKSTPETDTSGDNIFLQPAMLLLTRANCWQAKDILTFAEQHINLALTSAAWTDLAIQIALIIQRLTQFGPCSPLSVPLNLKGYDAEQQFIEALLPSLEQHFGYPLPEAEVAHLMLQICGAKREERPDTSADPVLLGRIFRLLDLCDVELKTKFRLQEDSILVKGLVTHLKPALHRISFHLPIRNPFLQEVREAYPQLFTVLQHASKTVFPKLDIPDEEIACLVLHIGSAIERNAQKTKRALVICSSGIGTSRMLASRLHTEFPDLETIDQLSWIEASDHRWDSYDLILSSIPLNLPPDAYLLITPLLRGEDVQKIKDHMAAKRAARLKQI